MKNSNKYLLAAVLVLLATLTAYNMALRTEYRQGTYKDPLRDYTTLNFRDFTAVDVPAAGVLSVKIVAGPYQVRLSPAAAPFVHLRQQGNHLVVTAKFPERQEFLGWREAVVISCPRLVALTTDAVCDVQGRPQLATQAPDYLLVRVQGFAQDSLMLTQDRGSHIELTANRLAYLRADAGRSSGSHSLLRLTSDNHIGAADLALAHQSALELHDVLIPQLRYQVGDSTQVTLTGSALRSLTK